MSTQTTTQQATGNQPVASGLSDQRPWAIYARKSRIGVGATITRENQWGACTDYAHAWAGPQVELVYFFDNASGWDEDAKRDDWDRLLAGIARGDYAGVVAWHVDRYTRQVSVGEHLWQLCKASGTQLHTKLGGHQTSALAFTVQNAVARDESEIKSERLKLKHDQLAKDGKVHGGRRAYGYADTARSALHPVEAEHIRWAAQQVLAGRSIRGITAELTARGALTATGKAWRAGNLGAYLRQPQLAKLRQHRGQVIGAATWAAPAILDEGTWDAVRTLLENPERRVSKRAPRVYLLSGIATCGSCGGVLRGRSNASAGKVSAYFCGADGCPGKVYRRADLVDAQVTAEVIARLSQMDATGALVVPDELPQTDVIADQLATIAAGLASQQRMHLLGQINDEQLAAASTLAAELTADLRAQQSELAVQQREPLAVLEGLAGAANVAELWHGQAPLPSGQVMDLDRRRAVVRFLCTVVVLPTPSRAEQRVYDPALVRVTFA